MLSLTEQALTTFDNLRKSVRVKKWSRTSGRRGGGWGTFALTSSEETAGRADPHPFRTGRLRRPRVIATN